MKKLSIGVLMFVLLFAAHTVSAVAIDDSITPQNCDRTDAHCAQFMDTTSTGQIKWGGLVAGGLRSLTNLFVDGKLGVGTFHPATGEQALRISANGAVGAKFYCDYNGNHCVPGDQLGGSGSSLTLIGGNGISIVKDSTTNAYTISLTGGSFGGNNFWATSTNPANIYNLNAGNVGIGLQNPSQKLDVNGNILAGDRNTNQDSYLELASSGAGSVRISRTGTDLTNSALVFSTTYSTLGERMRITGQGNVGIGTTNPSGAQLVVKQAASAGAQAGNPIADFTNFNNSAFVKLGLNGTGVDTSSTNDGASSLYAHSSGANAIGVAGLASGAGETYGSKFAGTKVGTFTKGAVALYATDFTNASKQSTAGRDNRIPADLAASGAQYAGYFDGNVNINGVLTVNGAPVTSSNSYQIGQYCGAFTSGDAVQSSNIPCEGMNIYKGGDKDKISSYQCPAKFTLVGGDFQSPGNRYFYACVRTQN